MTKEEGGMKKEEGRRKKEEGIRKKEEEGRRKKEEEEGGSFACSKMFWGEQFGRLILSWAFFY
jgi:hypothetical protein